MPLSDPADIAVALMREESTSEHEEPAVAAAERLLRAGGWTTTRIPVSPGRDALYAAVVDSPLVTLSTHLDTVPPFIPPRREGDTLHGRGACDAKGIAASMICAAAQLRERGAPVALLFVIGEETSHDGARASNRWIVDALPTARRALINGEPTEGTLALGTKGAMRFNIRTEGRAAHSAYPELGESAIEKLVEILGGMGALQLPVDPVLGPTTINIGFISGGVADNVIAPRAEAKLMARLVGSDAELLRLVTRFIGDRATVEQGVTVPAVRLTPLEGFPTSVAAFATDIPALGNWGTPFLFGPGSVHVAHTDHEFVLVSELERAVDSYVSIAERALQLVTREG